MLSPLTDVDYRRHFGLVAALVEADGTRIVGEARYAGEGEEAEVAVLVADQWQRQGIARRMLRILREAAGRTGSFELMFCRVQGSYTAMHALARSCAFELFDADEPGTDRFERRMPNGQP